MSQAARALERARNVNNMDKFGMHNQSEQLFARHTGTGKADTTKHEWLTNQHRDTLAHYVSDNSLALYISIAEGQSIAQTKLNMLERLSSKDPCSK